MHGRCPAKTKWQVDFALSCSGLGVCSVLHEDERRRYLRRGLEILQGLKASGRLAPNQDWTGWFEEKLAGLDKEG